MGALSNCEEWSSAKLIIAYKQTLDPNQIA